MYNFNKDITCSDRLIIAQKTKTVNKPTNYKLQQIKRPGIPNKALALSIYYSGSPVSAQQIQEDVKQYNDYVSFLNEVPGFITAFTENGLTISKTQALAIWPEEVVKKIFSLNRYYFETPLHVEQDILYDCNYIQSLDITPTMFKNANEKYHNIADFLSEHGLEADFYPQGSFALGTVVRPNAKDDNAAYDLDAVCQVTDAKNNLTAKELFNKVRSIFEKSSLYNDKIKVYPKCITIEYSDAGGAKFSIDIIPAVDEEEKIKSEQRLQTNRPDLIGTAIAIPKHSQTNYAWFTNNPRGYKQWFDEINKPYKQYAETTRQKIFETAHMVYDSVEDIPDNLIRTSLQRVIQILKRNRDVYYASLENGDEIKPISAIITTIVAEMAKYATIY